MKHQEEADKPGKAINFKVPFAVHVLSLVNGDLIGISSSLIHYLP